MSAARIFRLCINAERPRMSAVRHSLQNRCTRKSLDVRNAPRKLTYGKGIGICGDGPIPEEIGYLKKIPAGGRPESLRPPRAIEGHEASRRRRTRANAAWAERNEARREGPALEDAAWELRRGTTPRSPLTFTLPRRWPSPSPGPDGCVTVVGVVAGWK
jgi:hypothetical protein